MKRHLLALLVPLLSCLLLPQMAAAQGQGMRLFEWSGGYNNAGGIGNPTDPPEIYTEAQTAPAEYATQPSYTTYGDYAVPSTVPGETVVGNPYAPQQTVASYQSFYPNAGAMGDRPALINVRVPAQAELWIDNVPMTARTGSFRQFQSQPLEPGYNYSYQVRARWMENGQPVERSQKVTFQAGQQANVNLMSQSGGS
jgi:uncharacterized protein (TIGR03000 family)